MGNEGWSLRHRRPTCLISWWYVYRIGKSYETLLSYERNLVGHPCHAEWCHLRSHVILTWISRDECTRPHTSFEAETSDRASSQMWVKSAKRRSFLEGMAKKMNETGPLILWYLNDVQHWVQLGRMPKVSGASPWFLSFNLGTVLIRHTFHPSLWTGLFRLPTRGVCLRLQKPVASSHYVWNSVTTFFGSVFRSTKWSFESKIPPRGNRGVCQSFIADAKSDF